MPLDLPENFSADKDSIKESYFTQTIVHNTESGETSASFGGHMLYLDRENSMELFELKSGECTKKTNNLKIWRCDDSDSLTEIQQKLSQILK